jgi:hypothetical protein
MYQTKSGNPAGGGREEKLTQSVCVDPERDGVQGPGVLHLAGRLEEGGGVRRRLPARAQQDHSRRLGLLYVREVQEHSWGQFCDFD